MTSINFSTHSSDLQDSYKRILASKDPADWVLYGYGQGNDLKFVESGEGGLEELKDEWEGSKIQFAFCRVVEPISNLPKFILISWCGDGVPVARKGLFNIHVNEVANYFKGFHLHIQARHEEDVEPKLIMQKVKDSTGAKYSIQQGVSNPSLAKPTALAAKKAFVPPPPTANKFSPPAAVAPPVVNNVSQQQAFEAPKPLFSSASSSYQPIKLDPKPLQATAPSQKEPAAKPLYSPATSSYQPIKTTPKPLVAPSAFQGNQSQQTAELAQPTYQSLANRSQAFNQPATNAASSYQPIKLAPKPLYGEGVASKTFVAPTQAPAVAVSPTYERKVSSGFIPPPQPVVTSAARDSATRRMEEQRKQEEKLALQRREEEEQLQQQKNKSSDSSGRAINERMEQMRLKDEKDRFQAEQQRAEQQQQQQRAERERLENAAAREREVEQERERELLQQAEQFKKVSAPTPVIPPNDITAVAVYDYSPGESNEIALQEGETIKNIEQIDEGWWCGTNSRGERGFFPSNYCELSSVGLAPLQNNNPEPAAAVQVNNSGGKSATAIYDYDAAEGNEISFITGEIITDIDISVSEDWWLGTNASGHVGLFPSGYVELQ